jgi:hypothetical protein
VKLMSCGGQPFNYIFGLLQTLTNLSPWWVGGTLAKALDVRWVCVALACVPLLGQTQNMQHGF